MQPTRHVRAHLNRQVGKRLAATAVLATGAAPPLWFLYDVPIDELGINPASVLIGVLYLVAVGGLALLALGKRGLVVTTDATDKELAGALAAARRKLRPVVTAIGLVATVWAGYLLWRLYAGA